MTEERKVQLATEVDATGAKQGFEQVKAGARDMAQGVAQAGQVAGKGMDSIADGAKRAADGFNREEGRIRAALQRATLDLQTFGKSASEKFEAKINVQGLDAAKFQPYIAALRQAEEAQRSLQQNQQAAGAADAFTASLRSQIAALREQAQLQSLSADEVLRYKAAQAGAGEASEPLIRELGQLRAAHQAVTKAALDQAAAEKSAAALAGRQTSFLDGLKQQSDAIGKTRADLLEMQAAQLGLASAAAPYIAKLREAEQSHRALGAGAKLTTFQVQQLGFQLHDFAVQVISGQNPLTAFVQQGSQLSGTFGGAGNAFRAVLSLLTPMRVALGAAAVGAGALALAMTHAESAARSLASVQAQLSGTGRGGLFSDGALKDFIDQLSLAPGVTREAATSIVSELAKVHDIGGGLFKDLGSIVADYAAATGQKAPEAARALARAFADPVKGAKELDEALGTLTSTQQLEIERLSRLGDTAGAQRVLFDALKGSVKGLADNAMTPLQRSVNDLGNAWERALQALDRSDGLRTLNALLGKTVDLVTFLVNNVGKLGGLGIIGLASIPGGLPSAIGGGVGSAIRRAIFGEEPAAGNGREAAGRVTDGAAAGNAQAQIAGNKATADEIKKALEAGEAYKSQAGQIAELKDQRTRLNKALQDSIALYGKESPQAKQLRDNIAGVNERIASTAKRGTGGGNEAQQVLDAQLEQRLKASRDALATERDQLSFSQRFLQGVYQAGELSLKDFFEQKRKAIADGAAAEIKELDAERAAVQAHLDATKRTSPKDSSALVKDQTRLQEIDAEQAKLRTAASREVVLANQEEGAAFRQLNEQVLAYRANLLQLQGDEAGAAKVRAQIAIEQAKTLAGQSGGTISQKDVDALGKAIAQNDQLAAARNRLTVTTSLLADEEQRVTTLQNLGAIGEIDALGRIGAARASRVGELQKEVELLEKLRAERPEDLQLRVDASRARLELDSLKDQLDPLKQKFDGIFRDAGAGLFADLENGTKPRDAIKNFATSLSRQINDVVSKDLAASLFGGNGALGGVGGFFADLFGGKDRNRPAPALDTSGVTQSLSSMKLAGIDPATQALARLQVEAEAAAVSLRNVTGIDLPPLPGTTGDFARLDRGQRAGESTVPDVLADASRSTERLAEANVSAASSVVRLASAAASGGNAMAQLPSVVQAIITAASASSAESSGGGLLGSIAGLLGGSSGGGAAVDLGTATGADLALFYSSGGYTGDIDPRKAAGIVHGKEYVFSAEAVAAIGVERLDRLHSRAKSGHLDDAPPGYADGGYVRDPGSSYQPQSRSVQYVAAPATTAKAGDTYVTHHHHYAITVQATPNTSRATALQTGREVGRGIEIARKRNG